VADLGLARLPHGPRDTGATLTPSGAVMGTADFIAPEQARDSRNADARSDVYSLGCSLYYLLTGRVPFPDGTFTEKMLRHLTEEPPPVEQLQPAVSPALAAVVRTMMARRPEERYQTAAEAATALSVVVGAGGDLATPPENSPRDVPVPNPASLSGAAIGSAPAPRVARRWLAALLLAGLAAAALLVALRPWDRRGQAEMPDTTTAGEATRIENSIGMKLVLIRPGRFLRGSPASEPGHRLREEPRREIVITRAFYIGVYEVTQAEYEKVTHHNPSYFSRHGPGKDKVAGEDTSRFPVESITWDDAREFCSKLSQLDAERRSGRVYRLPTEAEWEYACRAGTTSSYSFVGDARELGDHAWYNKNDGGKTHAVGQKKPNAWGLYDMHGNVWEWCADAFDWKFYRDGPATDPLCTGATQERVLRGGGWGEHGNPDWCRSAARGNRQRGDVESYHGLRVVLNAPGGAP
jgi:formylglycine-generating enzyme required for sulfatase activity